ncbi:MAG: uracil-DNA glycosylase, partial [Oscillospiraceae bacterium]|nr:uracil-DNA glycosylase [Oscillospiraceae bacterium]
QIISSEWITEMTHPRTVESDHFRGMEYGYLWWLIDRKKNIYITNIVKCRPPENRDPHPEESAACIEHLREQTRLLAPKIIVCLGRISATRIIDPNFKVTRQHGQFIEKGGILMMGTFHPAALLRNPNQKPAAMEDLLALRDKIREVCPEVYEL